jgi:AraC-like DNA-binding protein
MSVLVDEDVRTEDVGEAEALLGRVYRRGRIHETDRQFHFRQTVRGDERANLARFQISSYAAVTADFDDVVGIGLMSAGDYRATSNGLDVDSGGPFLLRPGEARSWFRRLDLTMVNLKPAGLEATAGYAPGSLRLPAVSPISSATSAAWVQAARYAAIAFGDDDLLRSDLLRTAIVDTLLATAVSTFPVEGRQPGHERHYPAPRTVRRAVRFIEEHAADPIGPVEIAAAAGLSPRGLQAAFSRALGTTPSDLLRGTRLEQARAELVAADPGLTSVARVARRWGFAHLGRFAAAYRTRFGELPSDTLRR